MNLVDQLHCPRCKSRLLPPAPSDLEAPRWSPGGPLRCSACEWIVPVVDGIADFVGDRRLSETDPLRFSGEQRHDDTASAELMTAIRSIAGDRWPATFGDVIELGCGSGQMTRILAQGLGGLVRTLLVADSSAETLAAARSRLMAAGLEADAAIAFVRLSGHEDSLRDAVADTVAGTAVLTRMINVRGFLAMVHRVLKPNGRALFVVPNRRYHLAFCHAMAAALVRLNVLRGAWPDQAGPTVRLMEALRLRLVHHGDLVFLSSLLEKHLFDPEELEDTAHEVGFASAEVLPLRPDPRGSETVRRLCQEAGALDTFTNDMAPLAPAGGTPWFNLLSRHDASASMLLWLNKGIGPRVRIFTARPPAPPLDSTHPEAALGGAPPRWSVELTARETPEGVALSVGGWCLANMDVVWVRVTLDGITHDAPVWRIRPDVHNIMNARGLYHPLNALCSGLDSQLLYQGLRPTEGRCKLAISVVLANGAVVKGPAPETLPMNDPVVITQ